MRLSAISFLAILCFLLAGIPCVVGDDVTNRAGLTRQDVIENHERRRDQLEKLLGSTKEKIEDHDSGRVLLDQEEYDKFARRIPLYERKLERLSKPLDNRDIERHLERDRIRAERYAARAEL